MIGIIGVSKDLCALVGPETVQISTECSIKNELLEETLTSVANQGEGECMLFSALHQIFGIGFPHSGNHLDCCIDMHCEDTDAIAGMSAHFSCGGKVI